MRGVIRLTFFDPATFRVVKILTVPAWLFYLMVAGVFMLGMVIAFLLIQFNVIQQIVLGYNEAILHTRLSELHSQVQALEKEVKECEVVVESLKHSLAPASVRLEKLNFREYPLPVKDFNLMYPVNGQLTAGFSPQLEHFGIDLAVREGAPIYAVYEGSVVFADWTLLGGYTVIIQHPGGWLSVYKHNREILVRQGEYVRQGTVIALAGGTGLLSRGSHLHFETWFDAMPVDPALFLDDHMRR